jgi:hypothetical protein
VIAEVTKRVWADRQMSQLRSAVYNSDTSTRAARLQVRYAMTPGLEVLNAICELVRDPEALPLGGSADSPWSDDTWLEWIRNRVRDLETESVAKMRKRFLKKKQEKLRSVDAWQDFLAKYRAVAKRMAKIETAMVYNFNDYPPASESEILETERKLGVVFPPSIKTFYLASNGWPADGWHAPAIHPLRLLAFLKDHDPTLYAIADDAEQKKGPFKDDPEGTRLAAYQLEQGLRVKRSIAMSFATNDTETILADPGIVDVDGEWPIGSWAHWHPAMTWSHSTFDGYMRSRLEGLREIEQE